MEANRTLIRRIVTASQTILGLLFLYAGAAKILDIGAFATQVRHFGLENVRLASWFAHYVPFLEVTCALALLARRSTIGAALLCIVLLIVFEGGLIYGWVHGYTGGCGCFGKLFGGTSLGTAFVRNLALLVLAGVGLAYEAVASGKEAVPE